MTGFNGAGTFCADDDISEMPPRCTVPPAPRPKGPARSARSSGDLTALIDAEPP